MSTHPGREMSMQSYASDRSGLAASFQSKGDFRASRSPAVPPDYMSKRNPKVTSEHHQWTIERWVKIDHDHDGYLNRKEIDSRHFRDALFEAVGGDHHQHVKINLEGLVDWVRRKSDVNGDGVISFAEFESFTNYLRHLRDGFADGYKAMAEIVFVMFDLNGDDTIDKEEFREVYRFFHGEKPKEDVFNREWASLDAHGQQRISRERYVQWLKETGMGRAMQNCFGPRSPRQTAPAGLGYADPSTVARRVGSPGRGTMPAGHTQSWEPGRRTGSPGSAEGPSGNMGAASWAPGRPADGSGGLGGGSVSWQQRGGAGQQSQQIGQQSQQSIQSQPNADESWWAEEPPMAASRPTQRFSNMSRSASDFNRSGSLRRAQRRKTPVSPQDRAPWNRRHHVVPSGNDQKPKRQREYFSRPQALPELQRYYETMQHVPMYQSLARGLMCDEPRPARMVLSTDAGPPTCPGRHVVAGEMLNRSGDPRPWNNRWQMSVSSRNQDLHPLHREYFDSPSLFGTSPSQRWRRMYSVQSPEGDWLNDFDP